MKDEEFAIRAVPERAVMRHGKGKPMKAFLHKKWGTNYAGQVLTNVEKGSIPDSVAEFYEDDEPTPNDVIRDPRDTDVNPLSARNDSIDVKKVQQVAKEQQDKIDRVEAGGDSNAEVDARIQQEEDETQAAARQADLVAAKRIEQAGGSTKAARGTPKAPKDAGRGTAAGRSRRRAPKA